MLLSVYREEITVADRRAWWVIVEKWWKIGRGIRTDIGFQYMFELSN